MISLDLMKSSEVRIAGDRSNWIWNIVRKFSWTNFYFGQQAYKLSAIKELTGLILCFHFTSKPFLGLVKEHTRGRQTYDGDELERKK